MARTWLAWDRRLVTPAIRTLDPNLVVLAYGTNEAADTDYRMDRYAEDLRRVLAMVRASAPGAACLLVGPSDRAVEVTRGASWRVWGRTAPVAEVQREVALSSGCSFWDWQQATGGPGSMVAWRMHDPPLAGRDLIHFTQAGYEESADRFLQAWWDAVDATGGREF
jgi:lysophospholipase L1-like esterase